jgi:pimeloyl-ACP methyl ester carboxylesterase
VPTFSAADGTFLHFELVGSGPHLICHGGGPGRAVAYLEDLGGLSRTRTLVLLDSRGTGHSALPADGVSLGFDLLARDVVALADHLHLGRFDLLAHSAGAIVAQQVITDVGERVARLVLVTPTSNLQAKGYADLDEIRDRRKGEEWYEGAAYARELLADGVTGLEAGRLMSALTPFFYATWGERQREHHSHAGAQLSRRAEAGFRGPGPDRGAIAAALADWSGQVLILVGAEDGMTGVVSGERVAAAFNSATVERIAGAGHYPWIDQPGVVSLTVERWLAR